ncbi:MAG TPA: Gfo/Idh/MocA family oxidoreductase [Steroidobacteraceae bacterium]
MSQQIQIGIVGVGKIARDQHIPCIAAHPGFKLLAVASRNNTVEGIASYPSLEQMLAGSPGLDAVAICTPPQAHYEAARTILASRRHVLMEKPPCASLGQLDSLVHLAKASGRSLYQTWHSQHARAVEPAARLLKQRQVRRVRITWKEDVRRWHPGQGWLWEPGGFGIFDPGMNALSILTRLIAEPVYPQAAQLFVPMNCAAPIAAEVELRTDSGILINASFDFRETGPQRWNIDLDTDEGAVHLSAGGGHLTLGDNPVPADPGSLDCEYAAIYRRFGELIQRGESDVDTRPLQLVSDIFLVAKQIPVESFEY